MLKIVSDVTNNDTTTWWNATTVNATVVKIQNIKSGEYIHVASEHQSSGKHPIARASLSEGSDWTLKKVTKNNQGKCVKIKLISVCAPTVLLYVLSSKSSSGNRPILNVSTSTDKGSEWKVVPVQCSSSSVIQEGTDLDTALYEEDTGPNALLMRKQRSVSVGPKGLQTSSMLQPSHITAVHTKL